MVWDEDYMQGFPSDYSFGAFREAHSISSTDTHVYRVSVPQCAAGCPCKFYFLIFTFDIFEFSF